MHSPCCSWSLNLCRPLPGSGHRGGFNPGPPPTRASQEEGWVRCVEVPLALCGTPHHLGFNLQRSFTGLSIRLPRASPRSGCPQHREERRLIVVPDLHPRTRSLPGSPWSQQRQVPSWAGLSSAETPRPGGIPGGNQLKVPAVLPTRDPERVLRGMKGGESSLTG